MKYRRKDFRMRRANIILVASLFLFVFVLTVGYSTISQNLILEGTANLVNETSFDTSKVEITLESSWGNGETYSYQYAIKIKNESDVAVENWRVGFDVPGSTEVVGSWGAETVVIGEMIYCTPLSYNSTIAPQTNLEFKIQLSMPIGEHKYTKVTYSDSNTSGGEDPDTPVVPSTTPTPTPTPVDPDNPEEPTPTPSPTPEVIKADSIYLDKQRLDLTVGDEGRLVATVNPSNVPGVITWTSSDTSVATVSNTGTVTAVGAGTCQITATIDNVSASCGVAVVPAQMDEGDMAVTVSTSGSWGSNGTYYSQYSFRITNNSDSAISSWQFNIDVPAGTTIGNGWNFNYSETDTGFVFSNGDWNGNIGAGGYAEFGLQFVSPEANFVPNIYNIVGN